MFINKIFKKGCDELNKFLEQSAPANSTKQYSAGVVVMIGNNYGIGYAQKGAEDTFSIGQPVYDETDHLLGYLGIILFESLDYGHPNNKQGVRIPVEAWGIMLPTKYCEVGTRVRTYWQMVEIREERGDE